jgi:hypothetical protein
MHRTAGGERLNSRSVVAELFEHLPAMFAEPRGGLRHMGLAALEAGRTTQQTHPTELAMIDFDDAVVVQDLRIGRAVFEGLTKNDVPDLRDKVRGMIEAELAAMRA